MPLFLLALLVIGQVAPGSDSQKHMDALKPYVGKVLENLQGEEADKLADILDALLPSHVMRTSNGDPVPSKQRRLFSYVPWYVWHFTRNGEGSSYVLLEIDNSLPNPATALVRITLLDPSGKLLSDTKFGTGGRSRVAHAKLDSLFSGEFPILVLRTGWYPAKEFYGRIGNRFDLIRLEDREGKAMRNWYAHKSSLIGPELPKQSGDQWESDLLGKDRLRVLRALTWLGGQHLASGKVPGPQDEPKEAVALVNAVRARPAVIERLKQLAEAKNKWEQEAAKLALNPED